MILSDLSIREALEDGELEIKPAPRDRDFQPASLEVHLDAGSMAGWILEPGEFALGVTVEWIRLNSTIAAQLTGKSSLGRLGLLVHATAGWIDPGFQGNLVLELKNLGHRDIYLAAGQPIGQLVFQYLDRAAARPYGHPELGSHYQDQRGIVHSYLEKTDT